MPFKIAPPLYYVWASMKDRCGNPNSKAFPDYGGRGIKVCERWRSSYADFSADMGARPGGYSIDRIDNDGDYAPGNCRWASRKEQQRNQRRAVYVVIDGTRYRAIELAEMSGLKAETIIERANRGLSYEQVIQRERHRPDYSKLIPIVVARANATKAAKTHCRRGHEYTTENTRLTKKGWRECRACAAMKASRYRAEAYIT